MLKKIFIVSLIVALVSGACRRNENIDLLVMNARIYTTDKDFTVKEAMAVHQGKILETGTTEELLEKYAAAHKLDAQNQTIVPGFIDAHCHFTGFATDMWKCSLTGTRSFEEVLERTRAYAEHAPMHWIYGRGWDQNDWEDKTYPDNNPLKLLFPDRPVFLKRIDGHAALVNQVALDLAGITPKTKIAGGEIEVKNGRLTGLLIDNAMDLVDGLVPPVSDSLAVKYYEKAQEICFEHGLTQVQDCGISEHTAALLEQELVSGRLKIKVFALLNDDSTYYDKWIKKGVYRQGKLTIGGFKLYADGALGSRGACLLSPYNDKKGWHGFMLRGHRYLKTIAEKLAETDLQVCTHAIGDSANRAMLEIYGDALNGRKNKRWRIEHAQVVNAEDFKLFKRYDVIPSVQPTHATSDMYWADERLGESRLQNAYAYRKLLDETGVLPLGTDFPVEDLSPLKTFYAAVTRKDSSGFPENGFLPSQALTREQALRGMTCWASYAIFEENIKGSLEPGKAADFVLLSQDIISCNEDAILKTKILATYLDGELVH